MADFEVFLAESEPLFKSDGVLPNIWPVFELFTERLVDQVGRSSSSELEANFIDALIRINDFSDEIFTEEREIILMSLYKLAELAGLGVDPLFIEEWRGDW